ncbi:putative zinc metalloprotease [Patellaria atrata CBS 101060]|uniref:Zinc metalloprotease n=1 Tax=Patellaria atrata CBS 101060 TaxID=1346257 RepID=A0A9P4SHL0_9PEZI|nr:putative zinc metalloprotease [Patellaria atrata CBS 101060]
MSAAKERKTIFKRIQNFKSEFALAEFTQYESERTGMRVAVVDRKGPKVLGYFTLATEIFDDSGAPHTLEHLCFMGSKSFKYKGVLDKLATRAYSETNAWTAVDNTTYTLNTAGWEGFAQILPIYLEHVLVPTLTDAGCYTEVHHIDGTGHDAGVVYSEMQGVQNTQEELMQLRARRLIYPEGDGFRYETGGMMEALRILTADRIRQFHRDMYQPKNLRVIVIGEVAHDHLLEVLDKFEDDILADVPSLDAPFKRPWVDSKPTPPIAETIIDTVEFPEEDETSGEICIGFLGPSCEDLLQDAAMEVLLTYLADSSVSVLENTIVEKEQLASSVWYLNETRPSMMIWFGLTSVAAEKLAHVERRFFEILKETASKPFDMNYMRECILRIKRQIKLAYESGNDIYAGPIIEDHCFGKRDGSDLFESMSTIKHYDMVQTWTDNQWREFLSYWLADAKHVSILGTPSKKLSRKLKEDEKARVKEQKERLGEEGLKRLAKKLEEARAENDKEIPREILEHLPIPNVESVHFHETTTARSGLAKAMGPLDNDIQKVIDEKGSDLPLFIHFEHIPSSFVQIKLVFSTGAIPLQLKPLLPIAVTNFFTTPIIRDGQRIEFEKVVTELEQDTIKYSIGSSGVGNSELGCIKFIVEPAKYQTAINWLRTMMFDSVFDEERLKTTIIKMLAEIPDEKRSGYRMCSSVDSMIHFAPSSTTRSSNTLVKALYLKRVNRLLSDSPTEVVGMFETVRKSLFHFSNFRVTVTANLQGLENPVSPWKFLIDGLDTSSPLLPLDSRRSVLSEKGLNPGGLAYIVPMPTIDSSYAQFTALGPDSLSHPKLPALMVALAYLESVEGPIWVAVRGTGLAYGANFSRSTDIGLVGFHIYRSPDAFKAYQEARRVISAFADGSTEFEKPALEGAISFIVVQFADAEPTMMDAANASFVNQVIKGIPKDWSMQILKRIKQVGVEEIRDALKEFVLPLFEPKSANLVVTCATIMEEGLKKSFEEAGFKPKVKSLTDFQDDYGLKAGEASGDEESEDDEDADEESEDASEEDGDADN